MKKILSALLLFAAVIAFTGCEQFSANYQHVEYSEFRVLDFLYEPADAAPGDTVTLTAVFAGKNADLLGDIDWWISFNVISDMFGSKTVVDSVRLEAVAHEVIPDFYFSDNTQAIRFKFQIPKDIIKSSAAIPKFWVDMLPGNIGSTIPPPFSQITKNYIADMLYAAPDDLAENPYLPLLLQFFTVPIRVTAKHNLGKLPHTIYSDQTVRYNRRFHSKGHYGTPLNHNPVIDSVVVLMLKGENLMTFDPKLVKKRFRLDIKDPVIEVVDGYSYFIEAPSGSKLDWTTTMDGNRIAETHRAHWFFMLDPAEANLVKHTKYPDFGSIMGTQWSLMPPKDKRIEKFTFWVTVNDEVLNERMRPEASALKEVSGRFVYK